MRYCDGRPMELAILHPHIMLSSISFFYQEALEHIETHFTDLPENAEESYTYTEGKQCTLCSDPVLLPVGYNSTLQYEMYRHLEKLHWRSKKIIGTRLCDICGESLKVSDR